MRTYNYLRFFRLTNILARFYIRYRDRMEIRLESGRYFNSAVQILQGFNVLHIQGDSPQEKSKSYFLIFFKSSLLLRMALRYV